jgi:peptidyl-prolyl cis-trans isomerase SurA
MDETQKQNQTPQTSGPAGPVPSQPQQVSQPVEETGQVAEPAPAPMQTPDPSNQPQPTTAEKTKKTIPIYVFTALALVGVLVIVFMMFQNGDQAPAASTVIGVQPNQVVAIVNGEQVLGSDFLTSLNQIAATAQLQGIDVTDPNVQSELQQQAIEVLINTALLEQEAEKRGIAVSDSEVESRISDLVDEIGSQAMLEERMAALGIDDEGLRVDVRSELVIQALLDELFAAADISVSEEEIAALYDTTGSTDELESIRPQLEAQLRVSKEQQVLDELISELRSNADIELQQ